MFKIVGLYREHMKGTSSSAINYLLSDYVPRGLVLFLNRIVVYNGDTATRDIHYGVQRDDSFHIVGHLKNIGTTEYEDDKAEVFLNQNERLKVVFVSINADKSMQAWVNGFYIRKEDLLIKER